jgi:ribosomal protein S18 acetylase RimI-like enzyme
VAAGVSRIGTSASQDMAETCLLAAFASDPFTRWVLADPRDYPFLFLETLRFMGGLRHADSVGYLADGGVGAALWWPPGHGPDMESLGAALAGAQMPSAAPEVFGQMAQAHPQEPHWYLPFVGVDPAAQGRGVGSKLMAAALALVDADGLPAYLENTNPRNRPLYERFGFEPIGLIQAGDSPPVDAMWRKACR